MNHPSPPPEFGCFGVSGEPEASVFSFTPLYLSPCMQIFPRGSHKFQTLPFEYNYAAHVEIIRLSSSTQASMTTKHAEEQKLLLSICYISLLPLKSEKNIFISGRKSEIMPCFVPFNNSLDLTIFVLRSVSVLDDEIIHAMKCFSFQAEDLGCVYSSVMKSIHGNLVVWYGAWIKRSEEDRNNLNSTLLSAMEELSHLAVLLQHGFYDVYAGESKDGHTYAKFSSGDTVQLCGMLPASDDTSELSYACMAVLRSSFKNVEGAKAGVCFQCRDRPFVAMMHVWESLQACYSWLITSDYRRTIRPYISCFSEEAQFDIFKVIYVNSDDALN